MNSLKGDPFFLVSKVICRVNVSSGVEVLFCTVYGENFFLY